MKKLLFKIILLPTNPILSIAVLCTGLSILYISGLSNTLMHLFVASAFLQLIMLVSNIIKKNWTMAILRSIPVCYIFAVINSDSNYQFVSRLGFYVYITASGGIKNNCQIKQFVIGEKMERVGLCYTIISPAGNRYILYDSADQLTLPDNERNVVWRGQFISEILDGEYLVKSRSTVRIFGHFYSVVLVDEYAT